MIQLNIWVLNHSKAQQNAHCISLYSTLVLSFCIDVVLTLPIWTCTVDQILYMYLHTTCWVTVVVATHVWILANKPLCIHSKQLSWVLYREFCTGGIFCNSLFASNWVEHICHGTQLSTTRSHFKSKSCSYKISWNREVTRFPDRIFVSFWNWTYGLASVLPGRVSYISDSLETSQPDTVVRDFAKLYYIRVIKRYL